MARTGFTRFDFPIVIHSAGENRVEIRFGAPAGAGVVIDAPTGEGDVQNAIDGLDLAREAELWIRQTSGAPVTGIVLRRVTLEIRDTTQHRWAWESAVKAHLPPWGVDEIVRISSVLPRVGAIPLTVPLRILVLDADDAAALPSYIRSVFGKRDPVQVAEAIVAEPSTFVEVASFRSPLGWKVTDIVQFSRFPLAENPELQLHPSATAAPGTLGWLARLTDVWQTRLVILDYRSAEQAALAREVAARLAGRGGPAVIVRATGAGIEPLYDRLIHDFPLDALRLSWTPTRQADVDSLFMGSGREDLVRVSNVGSGLVALHDRIKARSSIRVVIGQKGLTGVPGIAGPVHDDLVATTRKNPLDTPFGRGLSRLKDEWNDYVFEFHERDGLLPMAGRIGDLRRLGPLVRATATRVARGPRHVNGTVWHGGATLTAVDAAKERLVVGRPYQLRVQIGRKNLAVPTSGSSAFLEEAIKWSPDSKGVFLEIGVSGVGFDIEGDRVQEVWLPREGETEAIHFAVRPVQNGVAILRYTLYYRQNIVQSFRIAALTAQEHRPGAPDVPERRALARALRAPLWKFPKATYVARLEFSGSPVDHVAALPPRALAILTNHTGDARQITVKSDSFDADASAGDIDDLVTDARSVMFDSSVKKVGLSRADWQNRFGLRRADNTRELVGALPKLAAVGWRLYDRLFARDVRRRLVPLLDPEGQIIHVAHVFLEDVIPWAALYDRPYDDGPLDDGQGHTIGRDVCLAAVPNADGVLPAVRCGELPTCLLHSDQIRARASRGEAALLEKTVACPLHFWGFKHIVELPAHQAGGAQSSTPRPTVVGVTGPAQLAAAVNGALPLAARHMQDLDSLTQRPAFPAVWKRREKGRGAILRALEDLDLDVIYLYCHTRGGLADPQVRPPRLEFQEGTGAPPTTITADQLDFAQPWTHGPLVIVNACSSAAFSPDAMSPFVRKFVRDRGAAGVIGTEIPVHEVLAGEFAYRYLDLFLQGKSAGETMLLVRRALLTAHNPLGISYTLYAVSELAIQRN